jgi:hypothetical protein
MNNMNKNKSPNLNLPDEKHSIEIFRKIRWSDGVYCPECHFI